METSILVIGGTAGSISVLLQILPAIDRNISFPIVVILHRKAHPKSGLDYLLAAHATLRVIEIEDKMELEDGVIYLAPADYHLLFEDTRIVSLDASEKVNYSHPSIDVTFQSASGIFGEKVAAFLLSGGNRDGVEGLTSIVQHRGRILVQDPLTAEVDYMPKQAIEALPEAIVLRPEQIAAYINHLKETNN